MKDLLLLQVTDDLMSVLLVLATRDVNPEIKVIAGFDDTLANAAQSTVIGGGTYSEGSRVNIFATPK